MKPLVIINFKAYVEAQGAIELALKCEEVDSNAEIIVAPAISDLSLVRTAVHIPVFSQHVDDVEAGAYTGHVTVSSIQAHGAVGTLINHSERPVSLEHIRNAVKLCKEKKLISVVCAPSLDAIRTVLGACAPDFIAYEPPELIGGNVSVTSAKTEIIRKAAEIVHEKKSKLLCGAGIKTGKDVRMALKLGCAGVLVSSGVVKAEDPKKALMDLVKAL